MDKGKQERKLMGIYHLIPKDYYKTREQLVAESGLSDRMVRREINELRKNPETMIISSSHGKGYKRPSNVEEIDQCIWESKSRINDEQEKIKALEKARRVLQIAEREPQMTFDF